MKLISMKDLILEIDWLTTREFCDKYNLQIPLPSGNAKVMADSLLTIDAIKHRFFVQYAKLLNKQLKPEMFVGDNPLFKGWKEPDSRNGNRRFKLNNNFTIRIDQYGFYMEPYDSCDGFRVTRIEDLCILGLEINYELK